MTTGFPMLEIDLGPYNGSRRFNTSDEIASFIENEIEAWGWLNEHPTNASFSGLSNSIFTQFNNLRNAFHSFTNEGSNNIEFITGYISSVFDAQRIPLSTSRLGAFIHNLKADAPGSAAAALAVWLQMDGVNLRNFEHLKGAVLLVAFDENITSRTPPAVKKSLVDLSKRFDTVGSQSEADRLSRKAEFHAERSHRRKLIGRYARRMSRVAASREKEANAAIASLVGTEQLFKEHMRLKGPVEYWTKKAAAHRTDAKTYRGLLLKFSICAGIALMLALTGLAAYAIHSAELARHPTAYLSLVTLGVVLSTMVFWAARILTRLFLSEHHLGIDAEERAVMAQTYLALTAEGRATEDERRIVLGSLFRPTADGIVKDDAAPDLSPAALFSKIASK
ncbi:MAG: DUF6161 domain-containing protein [Candidatus Kaistia colombiensis]|nr:MAG: DUF6161 domain-containing protein [Kaistia sp.]